MFRLKDLFAFCMLSALLGISHNAQAFSKLDFSAPVADIADKVGKTKEKIENVYNTQLEILNAKVEKVAGREGAMIFGYLKKNAGAIVTSAAKGQFYAGDFTGSGMWNALKGELGNLKLDYANSYRQAQLYLQAREQEKLKRKAAMEKELAKMQSEYSALNQRLTGKKAGEELSDEEKARLEELEAGIPKLQKEIAWEEEKNAAEDANYKKMQEKIKTQQKKINEMTAKTSEKEVVDMLGKQTKKLFEREGKDEENTELYTLVQDKLFLKKAEPENPENMNRVRKIRKQEYYKAVKNAMETAVTTYTSIEEIKERSLGCADAATQMAQGVFGAAAMRVCVELQNAKIAARYMEILLAQIRMETTYEMSFWRDKYKLQDYDKDMTTFNLDDYKMTKQTLFKKLKNKAQTAATNKINDTINGFTNVYSGF